MLARALRLILVCELGLYAVVGYLCASLDGIGLTTALMGALGVFLCLRLVLVIWSFSITRASPPRRGIALPSVPR
ncbi:MAG: hypothetical protein ABIP49_08205, partial [Lysobacterales bacterium]